MSANKGKLLIVGFGPGSFGHMSHRALEAIRESDVVIGYNTYVDLVRELLTDQQIVRTGMTEEVSRAQEAVRQAESGKKVAVISSGDAGVYGMAGLVYEVLIEKGWRQEDGVEVEVIPGISAINSSASLLGAPIMHDACTISLSDHLTPWKLIERRVEAAAAADFVIALYNPRSGRRTRQIVETQRILLQYRNPDTPVGIVKSAYRDRQQVVMTTLGEMLDHEIGMLTTVIIGNSSTRVYDGLMITPRGYQRKYTLGADVQPLKPHERLRSDAEPWALPEAEDRAPDGRPALRLKEKEAGADEFAEYGSESGEAGSDDDYMWEDELDMVTAQAEFDWRPGGRPEPEEERGSAPSGGAKPGYEPREFASVASGEAALAAAAEGTAAAALPKVMTGDVLTKATMTVGVQTSDGLSAGSASPLTLALEALMLVDLSCGKRPENEGVGGFAALGSDNPFRLEPVFEFAVSPGLANKKFSAVQMAALAELVGEEGELEYSPHHQLIVRVRTAEPEAVTARLRDQGLLLSPIGDVVQIKACDFCNMEKGEAVPYAERLQRELGGAGVPKELRIGFNGCGMACYGAVREDIGIVYRKEKFDLFLGGKTVGRNAHSAQPVAEGIEPEQLVEMVKRIVNRFRTEGHPNERFHKFFKRVKELEGFRHQELPAFVIENAVCGD